MWFWKCAHSNSKYISENMHCGNVRTIKHYPEFQLLGEPRLKATAMWEYLAQPAIKHHVRFPNSRCHGVQITESLEYRAWSTEHYKTDLLTACFFLKTTVVLKMRTYFKIRFWKHALLKCSYHKVLPRVPPRRAQTQGDSHAGLPCTACNQASCSSSKRLVSTLFVDTGLSKEQRVKSEE